MLIGVLETDCLAEDLQRHFGTYPQMLQHWLTKQCADLRFRVYQAIDGELPADYRDCDAYVITGSKHGAYDDLPWIKSLIQWVRGAHAVQVKLAGICFGHQLIAHALGGLTEKSKKGWGVGVHQYRIECPKLSQSLEQVELGFLVSHQDQVVKLPPEADLTLPSPFCEYAGFRIGAHILTFQGHPEFFPDYIRHLMQSRRERLGESCYLKAWDSLDHPTDSGSVAQWLLTALGVDQLVCAG
ncbi:MAG: hypothetical protein H6999_05395 [Hahellaceae bacterium]|nr:hypothetical protein [Hahellaceae bacterium]MCP5169173.1 hypothetical protein [Hahellaceae bacterium]